MIRFAMQIEPQYGFAFDEVVQLVQIAERTGYHALWTSDHLFWDAHSPSRNCFEAWTLLTALAPLTTTLRLGTLVTCNAYRHPSLLAKTVACLDTISQGRVDCGMGAGWNELEFRAYGLPFPPLGTRLAQLREAVQILKQLWTHERVSFHGTHYTLEDTLCAPKPLQQPLPLWLGGQSNRLLRLVAEAANGWNLVVRSTPADVQRKLEVLQRHCDAVGRDRATLDQSLLILTSLCDTEQEYARLQSEQARLLGPDMTASLEQSRQLDLVGSVAQVTDSLRRYLALGFDYVVALFPYTHERTLLQRYAEEVWPRLTN
jgi:F420-dependent oxidoreductase-like protein